MTSLHRWLIVVLVTAFAIGTPLALRELPAPSSESSSADRLAQLRAAEGSSYAGYVESLGTLQLPVSDEFDELGSLFGERTRMRVWWGNPELWRIDRLTATGETDLVRGSGGTTEWEYEGTNVTRAREPSVRLPRVSDLLPPELARTLSDGVTEAETQPLDSERIAGRTALGLRIRPTDPRSSIEHVDIWIDEETGIALRVSMFATGSSNPPLTSTFLDFDPATPSEQVYEFSPPRGSSVGQPHVVDIAEAANEFIPLHPPRTIAGLTKSRSEGLQGVGVYGSGLTRIVAIPLWDDVASPLREQIAATPNVQTLGPGPSLAVGPIGLLLTKFRSTAGGWLIAGTVNTATLIEAAKDVRQAQQTRPQFTEDH